MVLAIEGQEPQGNYRQRVFAAMPAYPMTATIAQLYAALPLVDRRVVQNAVAALVREGYLVRIKRFDGNVYRVQDAHTLPPQDGRGRRPRERKP